MKTIGIKLADGTFYPILEEGSPAEKSLDLTTAHNNQTKVTVDLYRSQTNSMDDAEYVDSLQIDNLVAHPNGDPDLSFTVSIDENNELSAKIIDTETGSQSKTTITLVSRTLEERLNTDEYGIADSSADNHTEHKTAVAGMGMGLLAAATAIRNKEESYISETPVGDETIIAEYEPASNAEIEDFENTNNDEESDLIKTPEITEEESVQEITTPADDFGLKDIISDDDVFTNLEEDMAISADSTEETKDENNFFDDTFNTEDSFISDDTPTSDYTASLDDTFTSDANASLDDTFTSDTNASLDDTLASDANASLDDTLASDANASLDDTLASDANASLDDTLTSDTTASLDDTFTSDATASLDDTLASDANASLDDTFTSDTTASLDDTLASDANASLDDTLASDANASLDDTFSFEEIPAKSDSDEESISTEDSFDINELGDLPDTFDTESYASEETISEENFSSTLFDDSDNNTDQYGIEEENADLPDINDMTFDFPEDDTETTASLDEDLFDMKNDDFDTDNDSFVSTSSGLSFTGLYDKETEMGDSSSYEEEEVQKKTKVPVIICIICAIICILATALILFVIPSNCNLLKKNKTVEIEPVVEIIEETSSPAPVIEEKLPEPVLEPEPEPVPEAKEDEIVIIEEAEKVIPVQPPVAEIKPENITYKIKWGDTLWDIANTYYKNPWRYKYIARYNGIKNPDHIISGTKIIIPAE